MFFRLFAGCLCLTPLWAQTSTGTIAASVTDPSGALVPGASVTLRHLATGEARGGIRIRRRSCRLGALGSAGRGKAAKYSFSL